jgi:hypothetical protein
VYFRSIIDDPARCRSNVVPVEELARDLRRPETTPNFAVISPDLCDDGHDVPCVDGRPGGLSAVDGFLREWVPVITRAPAFRKSGMLVVTFDEAESDGSSCCAEPQGPNVDRAGGEQGDGGGRVGAVVVSPFVAPGSLDATAYNHYSLLRTVEDLFGLAPLGYARRAERFGGVIFSK